MENSVDLSTLTSNLRALWVARFVFAANFCLAVYDYLITFEQEYWMVWRSRTGFSFMKLAFFLNRYFPVIPSLFVLLTYDALDPTNAKLCTDFMMTLSMFVTLQFVFCEVMLLLRAYIVWERNTLVGLICATLASAKAACSLYFSTEFARNTIYANLHLLSAGCVYGATGSLLRNLIFLACIESCALILLVSKAIWHYREMGKLLRYKFSDSPAILLTMVHDGVLYYIGMLAMTIANIIVNSTTEGPTRPVFVVFQATLQSVLCVRLIFHIADKHGNGRNDRSSSKEQTLTEWDLQPPRETFEIYGLCYSDQSETRVSLESGRSYRT